jgi:hypothetical protein
MEAVSHEGSYHAVGLVLRAMLAILVIVTLLSDQVQAWDSYRLKEFSS